MICWDGIAHTDLWVVQLNGKAQCVAMSPDGLAYAVGTRGGVLHVGKMETKEHVIQSLGKPLETVSFSPNGEYLAVGGHDMKIHVFRFEKDGYEDHVKVAECSGHQSIVKNIDWSSNSLYLRSNSADLDLLFWNPVTGDRVTDKDLVEDLAWASHSCVLTFESIGIWNTSDKEKTDINAVARSGELLAAAEDDGHVHLYSYPSTQVSNAGLSLVSSL